MFVRQSTQHNKAKHKRATNFTEAEGVALHKPGASEAKHTKHKLLNKAKHKRVTNFTGVEGIALHKPGVWEANTQNKVTD